jgi:hypothetical protein
MALAQNLHKTTNGTPSLESSGSITPQEARIREAAQDTRMTLNRFFILESSLICTMALRQVMQQLRIPCKVVFGSISSPHDPDEKSPWVWLETVEPMHQNNKKKGTKKPGKIIDICANSDAWHQVARENSVDYNDYEGMFQLSERMGLDFDTYDPNDLDDPEKSIVILDQEVKVGEGSIRFTYHHVKVGTPEMPLREIEKAISAPSVFYSELSESTRVAFNMAVVNAVGSVSG